MQRLYDLDDPEAAALLMSAFDTQSSGMISALDLLCGTILYSTGDIDNKLEGIFLAFDFRDSGTVHYDDFVVLLQVTWKVYVCNLGLLGIAALSDLNFYPTVLALSPSLSLSLTHTQTSHTCSHRFSLHLPLI